MFAVTLNNLMSSYPLKEIQAWMLSGGLRVPLSHAELSGHAVGLVLNHIRHKVWAQFDIGPPVASHIVIIGGREEGEDLMKHSSGELVPQQHSEEPF